MGRAGKALCSQPVSVGLKVRGVTNTLARVVFWKPPLRERDPELTGPM